MDTDLFHLSLSQRWTVIPIKEILYSKLDIQFNLSDGFLEPRTERLLQALTEFPDLARRYLVEIRVGEDVLACEGARKERHVQLMRRLNVIVYYAHRLQLFSYKGPLMDFVPKFNIFSRYQLETLTTYGGQITANFPYIRNLSINMLDITQWPWVLRHIRSLRQLSVRRTTAFSIPPSGSTLQSLHLRVLRLDGFSLDTWPNFNLPSLEEYHLESCSGAIASLHRLHSSAGRSLRVFSASKCDISGTGNQLGACLQLFYLTKLCLTFDGSAVAYEKLLPRLPSLKSLAIDGIAITPQMGTLFTQLKVIAEFFPALEDLALQLPNFSLHGPEAKELDSPLKLCLRKLEVLGMQPGTAKMELACHLAVPFLWQGGQLQVKMGDQAWNIMKRPTTRS